MIDYYNINKDSNLALFWLNGVIASLLYFIDFFFEINENIEWFVYFSIFILLILYLYISFSNKNKKFINYLLNFFSFFFIIHVLIYNEYNIINLFFLICSILFSFFYISNCSYKLNIFNIIIYSIIFFTLFIISSKIIYWIELSDYIWRDFDSENLKEKYLIFSDKYLKVFNLNRILNINSIKIIFFLSFVFAFICFLILLLKALTNFNKLKKKHYYILLILPFAIFAVEAFSTADFFDKRGGGAFLHWHVFVSPVEMIKKGGFLLWDVPSQYGFLNILTIYLMPFEDSWMKFYYFNSIIKYFFALLFFYTIWNKKNIYWFIISLLLVWSTLFLFQGSEYYYNSSRTPSNGPIRYIWLIVLCYLLVKLKDQSQIKQLKYIVPVFLCGLFWSIESAFCVSFTLLPYFFYHIFIKETEIKNKIFFLFSFIFPFLICLCFIIFIYLLKLKNFPDFLSFIEHAIAFKEGYYSALFVINGSFWIPLTVGSYILIQINNLKKKYYKFIIISIVFGLWSLSSYNVSQSINLGFLKMVCYYLFFFFLALKLLNINQSLEKIYFLTPFVLTILCFSYTSPYFIKHSFDVLKNQDYDFSNIFFEENETFREIIDIINPTNIPVTYMEPGRYKFTSINQEIKINYIPSYYMAVTLDALSDDRINTYTKRWIKRNPFNKTWLFYSLNDHWHKRYQEITIKNLQDYKVEKSFIVKNMKIELRVKN